MDIWLTVAVILSSIVLVVHCTCLIFVRFRRIYDKIPAVASHSLTCMVYAVLILIQFPIKSFGHNFLLRHIDAFLIASYFPFYTSILLLTVAFYRCAQRQHLKKLSTQTRIVSLSWCLAFTWLVLAYISIYQYNVDIEKVTRFGENYLVVIGLGLIAFSLTFVLFKLLISPCFEPTGIENTRRRLLDNKHRTLYKCYTVITPFTICASLSLLEVIPKVVFIVMSDKYNLIVLCRLLQRLVNGMLCISAAQNFWERHGRGMDLEREDLHHVDSGSDDAIEKDDRHDGKESSTSSSGRERFRSLYPKILVVVTDEYENIFEKAIFGRDVGYSVEHSVCV